MTSLIFKMNFIKNEMFPAGLIPVTETSHFYINFIILVVPAAYVAYFFNSIVPSIALVLPTVKVVFSRLCAKISGIWKTAAAV